MQHAESSLVRAMEKSGEKVASYIGDQPQPEKEVVESEPPISDKDLQLAFGMILEGNYFKIPEKHLQPLLERLEPFMDYVEQQSKLNQKEISQ